MDTFFLAITDFFLYQIVPLSEVDRKAKLFLCSKYLETFTHLKERVKNFADLSVELLVGIRDLVTANQKVLARSSWSWTL